MGLNEKSNLDKIMGRMARFKDSGSSGEGEIYGQVIRDTIRFLWEKDSIEMVYDGKKYIPKGIDPQA